MADDTIYITVIFPDGIRTMYKISAFLQLNLRDLFLNCDPGAPCKFSKRGCSTCHVKVLSGAEKMPKITPEETAMLNMLRDVDKQSRLACRIRINVRLNGLIVKIV